MSNLQYLEHNINNLFEMQNAKQVISIEIILFWIDLQ